MQSKEIEFNRPMEIPLSKTYNPSNNLKLEKWFKN